MFRVVAFDRWENDRFEGYGATEREARLNCRNAIIQHLRSHPQSNESVNSFGLVCVTSSVVAK